MPEASHAASEHHAQDEQVCPQEYSAADPITLPEPAHQWTEERRGQPLEGKSDGDREVAPAEPLGALQVGNQHADGKPHRGSDHAYHRSDRDDDPGVMEPRRAPGESSRVLGGHTPSESPQSQHVSPPYRRPSGERDACHRPSRSHRPPLALYSLQVICRSGNARVMGCQIVGEKVALLKSHFFAISWGRLPPDESQTFKAVVGHGLYPLHPALASPVRFVYSPLVVPLPTPSSLGGVCRHDPVSATSGDARSAAGSSCVRRRAVPEWSVCDVATRRCRSAGCAVGACLTHTTLYRDGCCRRTRCRLHAPGVFPPAP